MSSAQRLLNAALLGAGGLFCARVVLQWVVLPLDFSLPGPLVAALGAALAAQAVVNARRARCASLGGPAGCAPEPAPSAELGLRGGLGLAAGAVAAASAVCSGLGWTLAAAALLVAALGLGAWAQGWQARARRHWALLGLVVLLPPVPIVARVPLLAAMARLGAALAWGMARALGHSATLDDTFVRGPEFYIKVIDSCSGFYMVVMFLVIALTFAAQRSWGRRAGGAVLAVAVPLGLLLNGARLTTIFILGQRDPATVAVDTLAHDLPGIVLFGLGVALLAGLGRLVARRGARSKPAGPTSHSGVAQR